MSRLLVIVVLMCAAVAHAVAEEGMTENSLMNEEFSMHGDEGEFEKRMAQELNEEDVESSQSSAVSDEPSRTGRGMVGDFAAHVVLECLLTRDWRCVQTRTIRAVTEWFTSGSSKVHYTEDDSQADGKQIQRTLVRQLTKAMYEGFSAVFLAKNESERRSMVLRGSYAIDDAVGSVEKLEDEDYSRKKDKKDKKGAMELIEKLILLKAAIFTKISTLIQMKTFVVMKLALLISAAKLLMQIKAKQSSSGGSHVIKIVQMSSSPQEEHHQGSEHVYDHQQQDQGPELQTPPQQYDSYNRREHNPYYGQQQDEPRYFQDKYQKIYRRRR